MSALTRLFAADERGTSVVELALLMPVLSSMLIGMVDISRAYSAKLQLEQAAQRSIEMVQEYRTTYTTSDTYTTLKNEAAAAANVNVSAVTIDYWLECNGTRQTTYDMECNPGQTETRYVTLSIQKMFTPMFGSRFFPGANANGTYTLTGRAGLRTK